jgi:hypothetical protein
MKKEISRRDFLKLSFHAGGSIIATQSIGGRTVYGGEKNALK